MPTSVLSVLKRFAGLACKPRNHLLCISCTVFDFERIEDLLKHGAGGDNAKLATIGHPALSDGRQTIGSNFLRFGQGQQQEAGDEPAIVRRAGGLKINRPALVPVVVLPGHVLRDSAADVTASMVASFMMDSRVV